MYPLLSYISKKKGPKEDQVSANFKKVLITSKDQKANTNAMTMAVGVRLLIFYYG
jgi:hypothetical protein